jgi:hypothetical protein
MSEQEPSLVRYLRDPSLLLKDALALAHETLEAVLPLAPFVGAIVVAFAIAGVILGRRRERRLAGGARLIAIGVPPEVEPEGALLL